MAISWAKFGRTRLELGQFRAKIGATPIDIAPTWSIPVQRWPERHQSKPLDTVASFFAGDLTIVCATSTELGLLWAKFGQESAQVGRTPLCFA